MKAALVIAVTCIVVSAFAFRTPTLRSIRVRRGAMQVMALDEETFREYPTEYKDSGLPLLPDANNYWSGSSEDMFWHQNSDNVFVFIPLEDSHNKRNINVDFQALSVTVNLPGKDKIEFSCEERLIPDGSFWIIEEDKDGKRFLHLDIEKRFRMINWKALFGDTPAEDSADDIEKRSKMLEKLFAANKGMSKLTGQEPESINEMLENEDLVRMMADKIYGPEVVGVKDDEGNRLDDILADIDFDVNELGGVTLDEDEDEGEDGDKIKNDGVIDVEAE
jgi:hypothetical protein